jgi:hypothetical protein
MRLGWVPGLDDGGDRAQPDQDRHGASLAGEPDRRPSRPVVSPTYAQGSCYGTNRVVASAPGLLMGPATPLLSTTRAAQPSGRDPSRSRCSVVRTGRVSRKKRGRGDAGTRGRGDAGTRGRGDAGTRGRGDAGTRGRGDAGTGKRQRVTRRHLGAYLDELIFRSNRRHNLAVAFGALLALGAMREPTTYDTITGASDIPRISCTPKAEADWQVDAAHEVPSAGHDISYFPGGNRTGTPRGMARWASEFRSMSCSCQVHLRRAHVIPSRLARPASSFGPRVNRVQDTAAPGARSVR